MSPGALCMYYKFDPQNKSMAFSSLQSFHWYCATHNLDKVRQFICDGADVNARDPDQHNSLHRALTRPGTAIGKQQQTAIVEALLQAGAGVNLPNKDGLSPLHLACKLNNTAIVKLLIERGANVHALYNNNATPIIMVFANISMKPAVQKFLGKEEITGSGFQKPWDEKVITGSGLKKSWDKKENWDDEEENWDVAEDTASAVHKHAEFAEAKFTLSSVEDTVRLLLDAGASVNGAGAGRATPLHVACARHDSSTVNLLIDRKAKVNTRDENGDMPLQIALRRPYFAANSMIAVELIKAGADIEVRGKQGSTPLHLASELKDLSVVQYLITRGADVNARRAHNHTPLHLVLDTSYKPEHWGIVKALMEAGAAIWAVGEGGNTPLQLASRHGHDTTILEVIKHRVPRLSKAHKGDKAMDPSNLEIFHYYCSKHNMDKVLEFIQSGVDVNARSYDQNTSLHSALTQPSSLSGEEQQPAIVETLLQAGADLHLPNKQGLSPLHLACKLMNTATCIVKLLIEKGADVNALDNNQETPILMVFGDNSVQKAWDTEENWDAAEVTIQHSWNPSQENWDTPENTTSADQKSVGFGGENWDLEIALDLPSVRDTVRILVNAGAWINVADGNGAMPLHLACIRQDADSVELLIDRKAHVNAEDTHGRMPLQRVFKKPYFPIKGRMAVDLIKAGANIDYRGKGGSTPLHLACELKDLSVVKQLISRGADVNARNASDNAPLHLVLDWSYKHEHLGFITALVESGADLEAVGKDGNTPLHLACREDIATVQELVQLGANVNATNTDGSTPLHLVVGLGNAGDIYVRPASSIEAAMAVIEAGADVSAKDKQHVTPLHMACGQGDLEMVQLLLAFLADPHAITLNGDTTLSYVMDIKIKAPELTRLLIEAGVSVNSKDASGQTLLERACGNKDDTYRREIVEVLFHCGADGAELQSTHGSGQPKFYTLCESGGAYQLDDLCECGMVLPANLHGYFTRRSDLRGRQKWLHLSVAVVLCRAGMKLTEEIHDLAVFLLPGPGTQGLQYFSMYIQFARVLNPYNISLQILTFRQAMTREHLMGVFAELVTLYKSPPTLKTLAINAVRTRLCEVGGSRSIQPQIEGLHPHVPKAIRADIRLSPKTESLVAELMKQT